MYYVCGLKVVSKYCPASCICCFVCGISDICLICIIVGLAAPFGHVVYASSEAYRMIVLRVHTIVMVFRHHVARCVVWLLVLIDEVMLVYQRLLCVRGVGSIPKRV